MIDKILKSVFGIDSTIEKTKIKRLALYLTAGREFFIVKMEGMSFLLVSVASDDRFGVIALNNQLNKLRQAMNCEVAFYFTRITKLQRETLIEKRIPFIAGADQIYLPFLGIVLRNNLRPESNLPADKMMPATQCLFLYLLYNKQEYVLKKQAAEDLRLTRTSITRASEQLKNMKLIIEEKRGKEIHMRTVSKGYELYMAAKPYLVTPIQRKVYVNDNNICDKLPIAGESALSNNSMLGKPRHKIYALSKGDEIVKNLKEVDIKWQEDKPIFQIELWKYDPELFAKDGMVDPVSMSASLADNDDERVQGELKKFMEEYEW